MQWVSFIIIVAILGIHGVYPDLFHVDKYSMALVFLLGIPLLFPFLKKAKWLGAEFEFKEEIEKTKHLVEKTEELTAKSDTYISKSTSYFQTFQLQNAHHLIDIDPNLSLASIRIEIERVLSSGIHTFMGKDALKQKSLRSYIQWYRKQGIISQFQAEALNTIVKMCNKAVHGANVSPDEAREIIELTERLNKSFAVGYSVNLEKNKSFKENGLLCEWEHCIEFSPLSENPTELSCHVFGHDCPGGVKTKKECMKTIEDIPEHRFISNN